MLIRASFPDLYLTSMLPALDEITMNRFDRNPEVYSQVFRMMDSNKSIEQTSEVAGLTTFHEVPENGSVRYDEPVPGFRQTYEHVQYGLGFKISKVMSDDDRFGVIQKLAGELGRSAKETIEVTSALIFNRGFDGAYTGPDGQPLFSASHPLVKGGGVQNNRPGSDADLDPASIEVALTDFRRMKDQTGKRIRVKPRTLMVPPELEFAAAEILGGSLRSDTANNTINAFKHRVGMPSFENLIVNEYLTDTDAFFVLADQADLDIRFYWREKPGTVHAVDFDTRAIKTAMWYRHAVGWSSFYGVYGSPGV
jgi:hypothetical protein